MATKTKDEYNYIKKFCKNTANEIMIVSLCFYYYYYCYFINYCKIVVNYLYRFIYKLLYIFTIFIHFLLCLILTKYNRNQYNKNIKKL